MNKKQLLEKKVMEYVIEEITHGFFDQCENISKACSYKDEIPMSFWYNEMSYHSSMMAINSGLSKAEIEQIRNEIISGICEKLLDESLEIDNYSRLLHALSILGVKKNAESVPEMRDNPKYDTAFALWELDNGSKDLWPTIQTIAWYASEASKKHSIRFRNIS